MGTPGDRNPDSVLRDESQPQRQQHPRRGVGATLAEAEDGQDGRARGDLLFLNRPIRLDEMEMRRTNEFNMNRRSK